MRPAASGVETTSGRGWSRSLASFRVRYTSRPAPRRARGTAPKACWPNTAEPRPAGLSQSAVFGQQALGIAVLEQPSPGRVTDHSLGRRNIALLQDSELNHTRKSRTLLRSVA